MDLWIGKIATAKPTVRKIEGNPQVMKPIHQLHKKIPSCCKWRQVSSACINLNNSVFKSSLFSFKPCLAWVSSLWFGSTLRFNWVFPKLPFLTTQGATLGRWWKKKSYMELSVVHTLTTISLLSLSFVIIPYEYCPLRGKNGKTMPYF